MDGGGLDIVEQSKHMGKGRDRKLEIIIADE